MKAHSLLLILLIPFGCITSKNPQLEKGIVTIDGKIQNYNNEPKNIILRHSFMLEESQTAMIDSLGNFTLKFEVLFPQVVSLRLPENRISIYAEQGNKIHLELKFSNQEKTIDIVDISGDNADVSQCIQAYLKYLPDIDFMPNFKTSSSAEFHNQLSRQIQTSDSINHLFIDSIKPPEKFINWLKYRTLYSYAAYERAFTDYNKKQYDKKLFPVDNDDAIVSNFDYPLFLENYMYNTYVRLNDKTSGLLDSNLIGEACSNILSEINKNETPGLSRDIMNYRVISWLIKEDPTQIKTIWEINKPHISNNAIVFLLDSISKINQTLSIFQLDSVLNNSNIFEHNFFQQISSQKKDQLTYIDCWATWCGSCFEQMPVLKEFEKQYEGNSISFVKICMSSDSLKWIKTLKSKNITGENYFLNKEQTDFFTSLLDFNSFPSYFIIDKYGNISKAPKPSDKKQLDDRIQKELKKSEKI